MLFAPSLEPPCRSVCSTASRTKRENSKEPTLARTLSDAAVHYTHSLVTSCDCHVSRQGAQFAEVWVEGSRYKELMEGQEKLSQQREELERQRKSLSKRRPPSGGTPSGGRSNSPAQPGKSGFVKPQVTW